jgi:polyhydroxyalkanoate synthesis regulator phasin
MEQYIFTVIITALTVLFSAEAWRYYRSKLNINYNKESMAEQRERAYVDSLEQRVCKLEDLLGTSAAEKDDLRDKVIDLTAEVATLRERVKSLEAENDRLKRV